MLKALKKWRDRGVREAAEGPAPTPPPHVVPPLESPRMPDSLAEANHEKREFLCALERMLLAGVIRERVYDEIEAYFARHAGAPLLVEWGWENIATSAPLEEDESLNAVITRSMAETGLKIAALALEGNTAAAVACTLEAKLAQAEWSARRGNQTVWLEPTGPNLTQQTRVPDWLALEHRAG